MLSVFTMEPSTTHCNAPTAVRRIIRVRRQIASAVHCSPHLIFWRSASTVRTIEIAHSFSTNRGSEASARFRYATTKITAGDEWGGTAVAGTQPKRIFVTAAYPFNCDKSPIAVSGQGWGIGHQLPLAMMRMANRTRPTGTAAIMPPRKQRIPSAVMRKLIMRPSPIL